MDARYFLEESEECSFVAMVLVEGERGADGTVLLAVGESEVVDDLVAGRFGLADETVRVKGPGPHGAELRIRRREVTLSGQVLIVDDEPLNRRLYTSVLEELGLEVVVAATATEGLQTAVDVDPDLALVDIRLPDFNGFELARRLACEDGFTGQVVLMSVDPTLSDPDRLASVGAVDFIENPVRVSDLSVRLRRLDLSKRRHRSSNDRASEPKDDVARPVAISFFGAPALFVEGIRHPLPAGKTTTVLAFLAASWPAVVSPEQLGRFAWGQKSYSANAVYTTVSRLRTLLAKLGAPHVVRREAGGYCLDIGPDAVDVVRFESEARRLVSDRAATVGQLLDLLDAWTAPPFAGTEVESLRRWSIRLAEARAQVLELLGAKLLLDGEPTRCVEVCRQLLEEEPWRENVWGTLVVALYRSGRANDALQALRDATGRLQSELGLEPGPALTALEYMVLTHDPALADWKPGSADPAAGSTGGARLPEGQRGEGAR